jgi:beta-glucanase (GH16 family)
LDLPPTHSPPTHWPVAFAEEFEELHLADRSDAATWATTYPWGARTNAGNRELQLYLDRGWRDRNGRPGASDPFSVEGGVLTITARQLPVEERGRHEGFRYVSGIITTYPSFAQTYGYFEMRARLPAGRGLWPAFWLLPVSQRWPPEIDVFETVGQRPEEVAMTLHSGAGGRHSQVQHTHRGIDTSAGFHTYGLAWTPATITWYLDGRRVAQAETPPDMHQPMYMLANLAVGGTMPGRPAAATPFPAEFRIDYVRAYRMPEPQGAAQGRQDSPDRTPAEGAGLP